ncbi:MAG: HAD-IIIC family phosphatase [Rhodothermia bacterium]|nr:HAD-IIIC family phosphatase [Rhodothermia bacterium]
MSRAKEKANSEDAEDLLRRADATENPPADLCRQIASAYLQDSDHEGAYKWFRRSLSSSLEFIDWQAATQLLRRIDRAKAPFRRKAHVALLGSSTVVHLRALLETAAATIGLDLEVSEAPYGAFAQEILDPDSTLFATNPDFVLLAVDRSALNLASFSEDADTEIQREIDRWTALWSKISERCSAQILQFNFVQPPVEPLGHLAARSAGSQSAMIRQLNHRLGLAAGEEVIIVDCARLSERVGVDQWFDARYWHVAKESVAPKYLPFLARNVIGLVGAAAGLNRKCIVLDLDNTLWGGVVGEDGIEGIQIGSGPEGEAYLEFQEYLRQLKSKGIILAVCSKNNEGDAKLPFQAHPEMRLTLDDFAMFVANWENKADNIRQISQALSLGLDSFVFIDDSPVERQLVRSALPEVDVLFLPEDPSNYVNTLDAYVGLETLSLTPEDTRRTAQYRARADAALLRSSVQSLEEFQESLEMTAVISPFNEIDLPRIVQLLGKTNQLNMTTRRHSLSRVRSLMESKGSLHFSVRLRDKFTDHGLVGIVIGQKEANILEIDSFLMSCRVIGRTVESMMLSETCRRARDQGFTTIRGVFIPTAKNRPASEIFANHGFTHVHTDEDGRELWEYDLGDGDIENRFIEIELMKSEQLSTVE